MSKFWFIWPLNPFILSSYICEWKVRKDYFFGNISFRNDISLKTMKLGVLWWEKLKNRESQDRIVPWAWTSLGVEEQLPAELLIFSSCLSPGRVKKLQMIINFCLKVDHRANLNPSKSTWSQLIIVVWNVQNHNLTSKARSGPRNQENPGEKQPRFPSHFALEQFTSWQWIRACALHHSVNFKLATKMAQICDQPKECEEFGKKKPLHAR